MTPYLVGGENSKCCGCLSCVKACPVKALSVKKNAKGFFIPILNRNMCINCGKCLSVCQYSNNVEIYDNCSTQLFFAAKNKDISEQITSSSGGVFMAICKGFFEEHGVVFGAAWSEGLKVKYMAARSYKECHIFQGSKYVQSDLGNTYQEVLRALKQGERILFSGTPCQVAGLYTFLGKTSTENLLTCDLICHGTPSQQCFDNFITAMEHKYQSRVVSVEFKNKECGWRDPSLKMQFNNGAIYRQSVWDNPYGRLYHTRYSVMDCCNDCRYASLKRVSDLSIGDFWKYDSDKHGLGDASNGISVLIANTEKGHKFLDKVRNYAELQPISQEDAMQTHLQRSAIPPPKDMEKYYLRLFVKNNTLDMIERKMQSKKKINKVTVMLKSEAKQLLKFLHIRK